MRNVGEMTLMSHFAQADHPEGIGEAMRRIALATEGLQCAYSLSNSAATLWHPQAHYDWVRPGIICTARRRQDSGGILPIPD